MNSIALAISAGFSPGSSFATALAQAVDRFISFDVRVRRHACR